jgi:hypothetical protein
MVWLLLLHYKQRVGACMHCARLMTCGVLLLTTAHKIELLAIVARIVKLATAGMDAGC